MKSGSRILWNVVAVCEMTKTSWQMGNLGVKDGLENHAKGPIIPFGAMVEYHPISARDQARLHQFDKKVPLGNFVGYELIAGERLERRYPGRRH